MPGALRSSPAVPARAFVPALLAGLVVALLLVAASPPTGPTLSDESRWIAPMTWSNGLVNATFLTIRPAVTLGAAQASEPYGLYAGLTGLAEYAPNSTLLASAALPTNWTITNSTTASGLRLTYAATVPVLRASDGASVGTTAIVASFSEPTARAAGVDSAGRMTFSVEVNQWPWTGDHDSLGMTLPLWPNNGSLEYLSYAAGATRVDCVDADSHAVREEMSWDPNLTARSSTGASEPIETQTTASGSPGYLTLTVFFRGVTGGNYTRLQFSPELDVLGLPHPTPALPWYVYGSVAVGAAVLGALALAGLRSSWKRPPSLLMAAGGDR
jgi:hypothetical protein